MATTTGSHGVASFTAPINGTSPIDANSVRNNDNALRSAYVNHDADTGIHVQSSTLATRPAAGVAGRKWITTDTGSYKLWYDTGSVWEEVSAILPGDIVNADVSASAAIDYSKLASLPSANLLVGSSGNVPTVRAVTGDVLINNTGVTSIASGVIVDADISASAEIAVSKLADGATRQLLQTDAAGTGVEWTSNVDVPGTLDVTGATTLDALAGTGTRLVTTTSAGGLGATTILASNVVTGPASATDNAVARFDATTGKIIQNSTVLISDTGAVTGVLSITGQTAQDLTIESNPINDIVLKSLDMYFDASIIQSDGDEINLNGTEINLNGGNAGITLATSGIGTISIAGLGISLDPGIGVVDIVGTSGLRVNGTKVIGPQEATISDPTGGATIDSQARTAINTIIDRLQAHGLIA